MPKIEKIAAVSAASKKAAALIEPNKATFDALMQQKGGALGALAGQKDSTTVNQSYLADLSKNYGNKFTLDPTASAADLAQKTQTSVNKIEEVKNELNNIVQKNPNAKLDIPSEYRDVFNKQLNHINEDVKIALTQVGVEYTPPGQPKGNLLKPIESFLGKIANAQHEMTTLGDSLKGVAANGESMNFGQMVALQSKIYQIQYQAEAFSNMLNKLLDGFKTILNVQV